MAESSKSGSASCRGSERKPRSMKDTSSNELTESVKSTSTQRRSRKGSSRKRTSMKDASSNEMRESSKSASPSSKQKRRLSIDNIEKVAEALSTPDEPESSLSIVALTPAPKSRGRSMRTLPSKKVNKNQSDTSPPPLGKMPGAPTGARTSITICEIGKPSKPSLYATKESSWFKLSCSNSMNGSNFDDSYKHGDSQSSMQSSGATIMEGGNSNAPVAGALSRNNKNALSSMVGICFTDSDNEDDEDDKDVSDSDDAQDIEDDMPRIRKIVPTSELLLRDVQESELPASWAH